MKLIKSLAAVTALSLIAVPFARAQELETPTAKATPSPTEKSEVETSATPSEKPMATTEKSPATTTEKTASPTASPTKSKPAAGPSGKKMSVEASLKEMENKWEAAYAAHDASVPQSFVASDFIGVSSQGGKFINKSGLLSELKSNKDTHKSAVNEKLNVKIFGPNVAVVTGSAREKGTGKDGKAFDKTYHFTDTWMERNGQWQCIASQATLVSQK
jgi:ketosteroid isomerase-like protein